MQVILFESQIFIFVCVSFKDTCIHKMYINTNIYKADSVVCQELNSQSFSMYYIEKTIQ